MDEEKKEIKIYRRNNKKSKGYSWIFYVTIISFILSALLISVTSKVLQDVSVVTAMIILAIIIFIGIIFDTVGISVASASVATFHSMAAKKMYGAKKAIWLVNNADKVSSFCNDVIGDICGVISGAASALIIVVLLSNMESVETSWPNLVMSGLVASITVGGKAVGKRIAVNKGNNIVYKTGVIIQFFTGRREK
ncbi:MAG: Mg2+ and Co2+ transporter CorB [Clostridia bacterium]|nr:Mg2+ and Co2+ transporter CorB [Clostridia bacterium]